MTNRIANRHVCMISDVHVGDPQQTRLEDFDRDDDFACLLASVLPAWAGGPITLVIAGDFIDLPQILPELGKNSPGDRFGTTEAESLGRLELAMAGHPKVLGALRDFCAAKNQVLVLPGNHDIDLHFRAVWSAFRAALGDPPPERLAFVAEAAIDERRVYIEHGNQYSYDNRFDHWASPILDAPDGTKRIERPWGTLFMDIVYNDIEDAYPFVNKVHPSAALAGIVLRLMRDHPGVTLRALARLVRFFVLKGKKMIAGHLMGGDEVEPDQVPSRAQIEAFVDQLGPMDPTRRDELVAETQAIMPAAGAPTGGAGGLLGGGIAAGDAGAVPVDGLLGHTDERGLTERAEELIKRGKTSIIAFGHTHEPLHVEKQRNGRTIEIFNTGGWVPRIEVKKGTVPSLEELEAAERTHDLRYLLIDLEGGASGGPSASLETLATKAVRVEQAAAPRREPLGSA